MYVILWGHRHSTTTESQLERWMLLCFLLAACLACSRSELSGRFPEPLPISPKPLSHCQRVFFPANPNPTVSFAIGAQIPPCQIGVCQCLPDSAGRIRILPAESGFCRQTSCSEMAQKWLRVFLPAESGFCQRKTCFGFVCRRIRILLA